MPSLNFNITCYNFTCQDTFYNYEQSDCWPNDIMPVGYYMNDSNLRAIDKCDSNCKTCTDSSTKCLTCKTDKPYLYLSKCLNECKYDYFPDKKCYCYDQKCKYCSEESMQYNLCKT